MFPLPVRLSQGFPHTDGWEAHISFRVISPSRTIATQLTQPERERIPLYEPLIIFPCKFQIDQLSPILSPPPNTHGALYPHPWALDTSAPLLAMVMEKLLKDLRTNNKLKCLKQFNSRAAVVLKDDDYNFSRGDFANLCGEIYLFYFIPGCEKTHPSPLLTPLPPPSRDNS